MSNNSEANAQTKEQTTETKIATAANSGFLDVPVLRLPECLIMLSPDQENGDKTYEGSIGFKYGPEKKDWLRLPYMSMKKLIDFCMENKEQFNAQLKKEREKNQVSDL